MLCGRCRVSSPEVLMETGECFTSMESFVKNSPDLINEITTYRFPFAATRPHMLAYLDEEMAKQRQLNAVCWLRVFLATLLRKMTHLFEWPGWRFEAASQRDLDRGNQAVDDAPSLRNYRPRRSSRKHVQAAYRWCRICCGLGGNRTCQHTGRPVGQRLGKQVTRKTNPT